MLIASIILCENREGWVNIYVVSGWQPCYLWRKLCIEIIVKIQYFTFAMFSTQKVENEVG